jgi:ubiquinone/menaquinone biosynthesis C-methylase UbiE
MDRLLELTHRVERRHFWFRSFRRFAEPLVVRAAGGVAEPRMLDAGCGTGVHLTWLARWGRVCGVDVAWTGLRYARQAGHRSLVRASAAELPFPDATFDVVTSFELWYALAEVDERAAVREAHRVLRPGGALVATVAALEWLRGNHSVLARELRRYTRRRLRMLLEEAGFRVERLTYTYCTLVPLLFPLRTLQRLKGLAPEAHAVAEMRVPPAFLNAVLTGLLALEAWIARFIDLPLGSSLIVLARKDPASARLSAAEQPSRSRSGRGQG